MAFKERVIESREVSKERRYYTAEIDGFDVGFDKDESGRVRVWMSPISWGDHMRMRLVDLYPKSASELEHLADVGPSVFRKIAEGLREALGEDLRSDIDKSMDESREQREKWLAEFTARK